MAGRGAFDDQDELSNYEPGGPRPQMTSRDTELTLGPWMLMGVAVVLLGCCAVSFALGYAVGHRTPRIPDATAAKASVPQPSVPSSDMRPKPAASATAQPTAPTAPVPDNIDEPMPTQQPASQPVAHPEAPQAVAPPASTATHTGSGYKVQVATFVHQDDADVLVHALSRRNYPVMAFRNAGDAMVHVEVGPFQTRDEAARWRQKLLSDGYNAILQ